MNPLADSMVDVQSPQQALRAYSSAKEYACGILCDAHRGESNRSERYDSGPFHARRASPDPGPPQGQHRVGSASEPRTSPRRYRSGAPTPGRDKSHLGHNPVSTLGNSGMPRSVTFNRAPATTSAPDQVSAGQPASINSSPASNSSLFVFDPPRSARIHARFKPRCTSASQVNPIPPYT